MKFRICLLIAILGLGSTAAAQNVVVLGNNVATGVFNTPPPIATTGAVTNPTEIGADLAGTIVPSGHPTVGFVEWGLTQLYGNVTTQTSVGAGTTSQPFSVTINIAECAQTYQWRLVALQTDTGLTDYGDPNTFTTSACPAPPPAPTVTTTAATFVDATFATLNGTVNPNGTSTTCLWEYGVGNYGSTTTAHDAGFGSSVVAIEHGPLTNLLCGTLYQDRAVCTNSGGVTTSSPGSTFTTLACPPGGARTVLTESDLTSVGRFVLPNNAFGSNQAQYSRGIAIRYESGTPHLLVLAGGHLQEYSIPTPVVSGTPPTATLLKDYGAPNTALMVQANGVTGTGIHVPELYGMCYEPTEGAAYIWYGDNYNSVASTANNPSTIKMVLNYAAGTATQSGPWNFAGINVKAVQSGCINIPTYWSSVYTPGKTLSAGFGGYFSILSVGDPRPAPSMFAFAPVTNEATMSELPTTALMNYGTELFLRGTVSPAFENRFDSADPKYINSWGDNVIAGTWVYTPTKHGVLFDVRVQRGVGDYVNSGLRFEGGVHRFYVVNPDVLAQVAQESLQPNQVQASSFFDNKYYDIDYNTYPWGLAPLVSLSSVTLSGTTATATSTAAHNLATGDFLIVKGADQSAYNVVSQITKIDNTHFSFGGVTSGTTTPATGTITARKMNSSFPTSATNSNPRGGVTFDDTTQRVYAAANTNVIAGQTRFTIYVFSVP